MLHAVEEMIGMLSYAISCLISAQRVDAFLQEEGLAQYAVGHSVGGGDTGISIGFEDATLVWSNASQQSEEAEPNFKLDNLNIEFKIGGLNLIMGPVASVSKCLTMWLGGSD